MAPYNTIMYILRQKPTQSSALPPLGKNKADRSLRFETGMFISFCIFSVRERLGFQKIFLHVNMRQAQLFGTNSECVQTKR